MKARVELWMAIFEGGWDPRREVFVGVDEPLVMYVGVAVGVENVGGTFMMLETGVGVLPFVLWEIKVPVCVTVETRSDLPESEMESRGCMTGAIVTK